MPTNLSRLLLTLFLALLISPACNKKVTSPTAIPEDQLLIAAAKNYFTHSLQQPQNRIQTGNTRQTAAKTPLWDSAYCLPLSNGKAVIVPVAYQKNLLIQTNFSGHQLYNLNQLAKLVIFTDSVSYHAQLITAFPDSTMPNKAPHSFSGITFVETWQGASINSYRFADNQIYGLQPSSNTKSRSVNIVEADAVKTPTGIISVCYEISGYNYSPDDPDDGYYWTESAGCDYEYLNSGISTGGGLSSGDYGSIGGAGGSPSPSSIILYNGNSNIANAKDYIKCFSNYGGSDHSYQVTLAVSQPVPGSRVAWTPTPGGPSGSTQANNPVNSGHTFLIFSEIFSDHSIVRNVGFYPQTFVSPWSLSSQGQLNDDEGHTYNIALVLTLDNGQFFNMLNYITQGSDSGYLYNLNSNNCTTFALDALNAGGINIPSPQGTWPFGGYGYDPGDLGEYIRSMQLSSNMTRNNVYNYHPNITTCQ